MRKMTATGVMLLLAVGVGRGDPPSVPAKLSGPALSPPPIPALPTIPPAAVGWSKAEKIDTPMKPDVKKLKEEVEKLTDPHETEPKKTDPSEERDRLQRKLDALLEKLNEKKESPKPPVKPQDPHDPHPPTTGSRPVTPEGGRPIDLVRAAGNFYKVNDVATAYDIVRVLDLSQVPKEDKAFAEYIRAACLRKQGKTTEAMEVYRAIADAKDDPFLAECAVVQLTTIRSSQELEAQLKQLKSRNKPK